MCKVYCANLSLEGTFEFYFGSLEDCVQVALNLHRGCNLPHKICVYSEDSSVVLTLISKQND